MTKDTIIKFLNNRCTDAELEEVVRWANTKAMDEESKNWGYSDWELFQSDENLRDDERFSTLFDKIQNKINIDNQKLKNNGNRKLYLINWLTRAAAILLIPALAILFYTISEKKTESKSLAKLAVDSLEIVAPIGSRTIVQLSDGTVVHLNYGSNLKYPQVFSDKTREVILSGEGYFDVACNPEKPFIVRTGEIKIKALGTSFNVLAYPDKNIIETTLVKGKVVLEKDQENKEVKIIGVMEPGQHLKYNTNAETKSCNKGNVEKYIGWKDGKLIFEDTPLPQVAERLSRMFNVNIEVTNEVKNYIYTVTFIDEPLFQILDLMTIATPVVYKTSPRKKLPDGTFSKQKIIIEKRNFKSKI
jgi:transmembrane sensor